MGDFPIVPPEPQAAPLSYELSSHQRFTPLAVSAVFDGTAAAGDFLPCCSIYAPGGQLIGRTFPSTVTAGTVVEVTYSPFARGGSAAAASVGNFVLIANANQSGTLPFGSWKTAIPADAVNGASAPALSASWLWLWEAGKQGNVSIRNNTANSVTLTLVGAWVRNTATGDEEVLTGTGVACAAGAVQLVTWQHVAGVALLDLSVPDRPAPFATGPYAVSVTVQAL